MHGFDYKEIGEMDFEISISDDLFQEIVNNSDNKPYEFSPLEPEEEKDKNTYYVFGKVMKWVISNKEFNTDRIISGFEIGYEEGYNDIKNAYTDKYVIGNLSIRKNLEILYGRFLPFRDYEPRSLNFNLIVFFGKICGTTYCIEQLAATYPYDFKGFKLTYSGQRIVEDEIITIYWKDYCSKLPDSTKPESLIDFQKRFNANANCNPLIPSGRAAGDEYSKTRDWLRKMLMDLKILAAGKYKNFDTYSLNAFGLVYSKIREQKKIDPT